MPVTNADEYLVFLTHQPEWEAPGYIKNTVIRDRETIHGGDGLWDLRAWETTLEAQGRIRNGKMGKNANYTVNPTKWQDFVNNGGRDNTRL